MDRWKKQEKFSLRIESESKRMCHKPDVQVGKREWKTLWTSGSRRWHEKSAHVLSEIGKLDVLFDEWWWSMWLIHAFCRLFLFLFRSKKECESLCKHPRLLDFTIQIPHRCVCVVISFVFLLLTHSLSYWNPGMHSSKKFSN